MRILICDDNPAIVEQLNTYISDFFTEINYKTLSIASYSNGETLLAKEHRADMAFLDVEMDGINGIRVGARLKEINPKIKIFIVTSFNEYLDEAMHYQVFRYLSKPIDKNRLILNLKDALYQYNMDKDKYVVETHDNVYSLQADEIIFVEVNGRKSLVHTTNGDLFSTEPISYWRDTLKKPVFYETHRSNIVNLHFIHQLTKDRILLRYKNRHYEAYLTRRKYNAFKNAYLLYMESVE